jgi:hypothetical protein
VKQDLDDIYDTEALMTLAQKVPGARFFSFNGDSALVERGIAEVTKLRREDTYDCWIHVYGEQPVIEALNVSEDDAISFLWCGFVLGGHK